MIVRGLDSEGDWNFGKGKSDYLSGQDAIVQTISTRLKSFLGDCFFATDAGIDWFNRLGSKNKLALQLDIQSVILNTEGVTGIVSVDTVFDSQSRGLSLTYVVNTIYTGLNAAGALESTLSFLLTEDGDIITTEDGGGLILG